MNDADICGPSHAGLKFDPLPSMNRAFRLDLCNQYRHDTCCNNTHIHKLKRPIHETRVAQFNTECRDLTEVLLCRPCHPLVGKGQMPSVCPSLCSKWFNACSKEYYAASGDGKLTPCYGNALVCSRLDAIVSNGDEMCRRMRMNFNDDDTVDAPCFDGSVPESTGIAEPTEPLIELLTKELQNLFNDQSPIVIAVALVLVVLIFSKKAFGGGGQSSERKLGTLDDDTSNLTLEQVRDRQQAQYAKDLAAAEALLGESDCSSSSEED